MNSPLYLILVTHFCNIWCIIKVNENKPVVHFLIFCILFRWRMQREAGGHPVAQLLQQQPLGRVDDADSGGWGVARAHQRARSHRVLGAPSDFLRGASRFSSSFLLGLSTRGTPPQAGTSLSRRSLLKSILKLQFFFYSHIYFQASVARSIAAQLQLRLTEALREFKRDKLGRQQARLSLANALHAHPALPKRRILLSTGAANYRPPLERSKSAPKLGPIDEISEEVIIMSFFFYF